jgi:hypothetical protein
MCHFVLEYGRTGNMNDDQHATLIKEVMALRMVLVHLLARQTPADLAAVSDSISRECDEHSLNVERVLTPLRATVDAMLLQASVVSRKRQPPTHG